MIACLQDIGVSPPVSVKLKHFNNNVLYHSGGYPSTPGILTVQHYPVVCTSPYSHSKSSVVFPIACYTFWQIVYL